MRRLALAFLPLAVVLLTGCGASERPPERQSAPPAAASPTEVVRSWLEAAKRGDNQAASALFTARARGLSTHFGVEWWSDLGEVVHKGPERRVEAHVVHREADGVEHPDNLYFNLVQQDGRWLIDGMGDFD